MGKQRKLLWILLPAAAVSLCACQGSPFTDADFTSRIFPNGYWDFLIQLCAFVLLLLIVFFLGYKPLRKMLKKRKDAIETMVADTERNQRIAREAAQTKDATIQEGKDEAGRIVASARAQAEAERQAILTRANEEAEARRRRADEDIAAAREASREEVRREIIDVAMLASETLLGREVNSEDNTRLVEGFVDSMNQEGNDGEAK